MLEAEQVRVVAGLREQVRQRLFGVEFPSGVGQPHQPVDVRITASKEASTTRRALWCRHEVVLEPNTLGGQAVNVRRLDVDLLCLWGAKDTEQPVEDGHRLTKDIGGKVVELDDAGHWVTEDRPEAYRDHLEAFLTET